MSSSSDPAAHSSAGAPESVRLSARSFAVMAYAKLAGLVLSGFAGAMSSTSVPEDFRAQIPQTIDPQTFMTWVKVASVGVNVVFGILFAGLIIVLSSRYVSGARASAGAGRALSFIAGFLALDSFVGLAGVGQFDVELWLTLALGFAAIVCGVAAILGLLWFVRKESTTWVEKVSG